MSAAKWVPAIEAMLFASGDAVSLTRMAQALEISKETAQQAVTLLQKRMAEDNSGLEVVTIEDGYQMTSKSCYAGGIRNLFELRRNTPLSQAAFEVLAVIAYNQPVTKAYVEQVRGVDCSGVIGSLSAKGLIEECGRLDLPGRPLLYATTENFLRCFSLSSLEELPPIPEPEQEPKGFSGNVDAQKTVLETKMEDFVTEE